MGVTKSRMTERLSKHTHTHMHTHTHTIDRVESEPSARGSLHHLTKPNTRVSVTLVWTSLLRPPRERERLFLLLHREEMVSSLP